MCPHQIHIADRLNFDGHTPETCFKLIDLQRSIDGINAQLTNGNVRMNLLEANLQNITGIIESGAAAHARVEAELKANNEATYEMRDIIQSGKGFFRTVGVLGKALTWILGIATALLAFFAALKAGGKV